MRDGIGILCTGDLDHSLGDQRPCNTGPEKILIFIDRTGSHHGKDEIAGKLLLQIIYVNLRGSRVAGLFIQPFEFLLLADIGAEGDHFCVVFIFNPRKQNRSIQPTRISQNNLHTQCSLRSNAKAALLERQFRAQPNRRKPPPFAVVEMSMQTPGSGATAETGSAAASASGSALPPLPSRESRRTLFPVFRALSGCGRARVNLWAARALPPSTILVSKIRPVWRGQDRGSDQGRYDEIPSTAIPARGVTIPASQTGRIPVVNILW